MGYGDDDDDSCMNSRVVPPFLSIVLFTIITIIAANFHQLSPLQAGLMKNSITGAVKDHVYTSGQYYMLFDYFVEYPITLQHMDFWGTKTLKASTNEGQTITLEVSLQYRLMVENLFQLYRTYEQSYQATYEAVAAQSIKNMAATSYSTTDFLQYREAIQEAMHVALNEALAPHYCIVEHFQLLHVTLPPQTDETILSKLISEQEVKITSANQEILVTEGDTEVILKEAEAEIVVIEARAQNEATKLLGEMNSYAASVHLNFTAGSFKYLKEKLNFTADETLHYMWMEHVRTLTSDSKSSVIVDVPDENIYLSSNI